MTNKDIFEYITTEEANYKTQPIPLTDGWEWNMYEHVRKSFLYKYGKFTTGTNDGLRPNNNIILPILNVGYRSQDIDVKEVIPYVDNSENSYKSFLVKKFSPRYARKNKIDASMDKSVVSFNDYGLVIAKKTKAKAPEIVPLQRIAFCDQTDFDSGPVCEKHQYSIDQFRAMAGAWDSDKIEEVIVNSDFEKDAAQTQGQKAQTPGKYIEVYELHGTFPESWMTENGKRDKYTGQFHIVTYYKDSKDNRIGVTLFKGKETKSIYKSKKRDEVFGRACGYGAVEELFEPQTWTNYSEIKIKEMLDAAATAVLLTTDDEFATRNNLAGRELEVNEVLVHGENTSVTSLVNQGLNLTTFNNNVVRWQEQARVTGSASDSSLAQNPTSGTPFALEQLITKEGKGLHEYRQEHIIDFWIDIYKDWILGDLVKEMNKGHQFLEMLSLEELEEVVDQIVTNSVNDRIKEGLMDGHPTSPEDQAMMTEVVRDGFMNDGGKKLIKIAKDEIKDIPMDVEIIIKGRNRDLAEISQKLSGVFGQIMANPQMLQIPGMGKLFNEIIESSGLSPIDFAGFKPQEEGSEEAPPTPTQPLTEVTQ